MAASINVADGTLAADGKTITTAISGGVGVYSLNSGTNGVDVRLTSGDGYVFYVASVAVSTTNLVITLRHPVFQGEAIGFRLNEAACTLTDTAGNTLVPVNSIPFHIPTINSTVVGTTLSLAQMGANAEINGQVGLNGYGANTGANEYSVEMVTDATDVAIMTLTSYTPTFSIDGGVSSTIAANPGSPGGRAYYPIATGLSAGKHLIRYTVPESAGVRITGGTRTLYGTPTTRSPFVTYSNSSSYGSTTAIPTVNGAYVLSSDNPGTVNSGGAGAGFEVAFNGTGLEIVTYLGAQQQAACSVDGAPYGPLLPMGGSLDTNNTFGWAQATPPGLPKTNHTARFIITAIPGGYRSIRVINGTVTAQATSSATDSTLTVVSNSLLSTGDWVRIDTDANREVRQIQNISGSVVTFTQALTKSHAAGIAVTSYSAPAGTLTKWFKPRSKIVVGLGDSNTHGWNNYYWGGKTPDSFGNYYDGYDLRSTGIWQVCETLGYEFLCLAQQGTGTGNQSSRVGDIANVLRGRTADIVTMWLGTNDIGAENQSPASFKANVQTMINASLAVLTPGTGKIILMPCATPFGVNSNGLDIAGVRTALQQLAATNGPQVVCLASLPTVLTPSDMVSPHYMPSGQKKVGEAIRAVFEREYPVSSFHLSM